MKTNKKNRKRWNRCFCFYLSIVCCMACSQEEFRQQSITGAGYRSLEVGSVNVADGEMPGRTTTAVTKGTLGVKLTNPSGGTNAYQAQYTNYSYDGGKNQWVGNPALMLGVENAAISAIFPSKTADADGRFQLKSQPYKEEEDVSYATAQNRNSLSTGNAVINFTMVRAYSQIEFVINRATTYTGNFSITTIGIKNDGIIGSATLDITNGTYKRTTNADFSYQADIGGKKETSLTSNVLMVPPNSAPTGKFTISLTIDGKTSSIDIKALALVAGTKYKVTINVEGRNQLSVSQVTVEDWQEVSDNTEYPI